MSSLLRNRIAAFGFALAALVALPLAPTNAQTYENLPPDLEERAQRIYSNVMCPQCAGQTIDESNAPVAEAMRGVIRTQLRDGRTNDAIMDSLVASYGEGILASPPVRGFSLVAWAIPPFALLLGVCVVALAIGSMRRRGPAAAPALGIESAGGSNGASLPFDLVDQELSGDLHTTEER